MKTPSTLYVLLVTLFLAAASCNKWDSSQIPVVITNDVTGVKSDQVTCIGSVAGNNIVVDEYGFCFNTEKYPTILHSKFQVGAGIGDFSSSFKGLLSNTEYHVRAYAITNRDILIYGNTVSFKTPDPEPVTDIDGNVYSTIRIGSQIWMAENLRATKYNDGASITHKPDNNSWGQNTAGYCYYNNSSDNFNKYGALYNYYAVETGKLCPTGWHVPSDEEWIELLMTLGLSFQESFEYGCKGYDVGSQLAAGEWMDGFLINSDKFGSSGFNALPGGCRSASYNFIGQSGYWWSNTSGNLLDIISRSISYKYGCVSKQGQNRYYGLSVRCIKD